MWGTIGIIYDSTRVTEPVTSWDILWDSKYKDEVYMFNSLRDSLAIALIKAGYSIESFYLLDFYPNTSHIESLAVLKYNN